MGFTNINGLIPRTLELNDYQQSIVKDGLYAVEVRAKNSALEMNEMAVVTSCYNKGGRDEANCFLAKFTKIEVLMLIYLSITTCCFSIIPVELFGSNIMSLSRNDHGKKQSRISVLFINLSLFS